MKTVKMLILTIVLSFIVSNAFGGISNDETEQQTEAIKEQTEAIKDQTKAIEDLRHNMQFQAMGDALEKSWAEQKKIREEGNKELEEHTKEMERKSKLYGEYVTGMNPSPEAVAEGKRRGEENRQFIIAKYGLPADTPNEFTNKVLVVIRGLDQTGEIPWEETKARIDKLVDDYKKSRGIVSVQSARECALSYELKNLNEALSKGLMDKEDFEEFKKKYSELYK